MSSALHNLAGTGKTLSLEPPDLREIEGLIRSARARLQDARNVNLSHESRFDLAYNASHALCLAALRRLGFRSSHRYLVFQLLPHTLGLGPEVWRVLDKCHQQRNIAEYEGHLDVSERLVLDLVDACDRVDCALNAVSSSSSSST
jgi:hypothetical protein